VYVTSTRKDLWNQRRVAESKRTIFASPTISRGYGVGLESFLPFFL
jgi:hypothetical protein